MKLPKLRRPFLKAHWSLFALLVLFLLVVLIDQTCKETPYYFQFTGLTAATFIALWCNHLRFAPVSSLSGIINVMIGAMYDLFILILILILPSLFMPITDCMTSRAKVVEIIVSTSTVKETITERINSSKSLDGVGIGLKLESNKRMKKWFITKDGIIIVASDDPPAVVFMQPAIENGEAKWKCEGFPEKYMPMECRLNQTNNKYQQLLN